MAHRDAVTQQIGIPRPEKFSALLRVGAARRDLHVKRAHPTLLLNTEDLTVYEIDYSRFSAVRETAVSD